MTHHRQENKTKTHSLGLWTSHTVPSPPHLCFWAKVTLGPLSGAFSLPSPTPLAKPGGARHFPAGLWIPPLALTLASHIPLLSLSFCICKMDVCSALEAQCPAHRKAQRRKMPRTWNLVGR